MVVWIIQNKPTFAAFRVLPLASQSYTVSGQVTAHLLKTLMWIMRQSIFEKVMLTKSHQHVNSGGKNPLKNCMLFCHFVKGWLMVARHLFPVYHYSFLIVGLQRAWWGEPILALTCHHHAGKLKSLISKLNSFCTYKKTTTWSLCSI